MTDLSSWSPPQLPPRTVIEGRYVTLEPLARAHAAELFAAYAEDGGAMWDYLPVGPFADLGAYTAWLDTARLGWDPLHYAVRMEDGRLGGTLSLMRIDPRAGSAEAGWLTFAPRLQRRREATEAVYRLMEWCFGAGYRRFEWKCHAANIPSRRAAQRFGLSYEGVFRQAGVVKGGNRDTAWYAAVDLEWPALKAAYERWLDPANFDATGAQKQRLSVLTRPVLAARDPLVG
ncbi:GNAT family N-acetyltransferase [Pararhodobacter marinus]|uniref:GNAT family N-acetyltransferase n=1 Tax=Pararhodobacter marinus TaxID=2184063 RepID=UPI0035188456